MALANSTDVKKLDLTTAAADAVRNLLEKRELEGYAVRVFVQGGGCSGFQYGMALEGKIREQDTVFEEHGVKVVIDEVSIEYMRGASIDYIEDVMGSGFKIDNPNAMSSCGCGTSFQTNEGSGTPSSCGGCG
ncbi:MAG: iron-sulfur cluster insertion protein ErpA [Anaerolineales bacterium]|nr:iron-sulfur cluster insertion protein ErpA [Anaerolineales bacterium]